jgi:hypothetical protein
MFGCFSPSSRRQAVSTRRLWLEALEMRDCPSTFVAGNTPVDVVAAYQNQQNNGPVGQLTLTFSHTMGAGHSIEVTGSVTAQAVSPANQVVEFEGPINGYVVTDQNGNFDFTVNASSLGNIDAAVVPEGPGGPGNSMQPVAGQVQSNVIQDVLADTAPVIANFAVQQVNGNEYQFTGTVTGSYVQGLTVTFGGQPLSLQGQKATVNADGTFTLLVDMVNGADDNGQASAQIKADGWGQASNVATVNVLVAQGNSLGGGGDS